MTGVTRPVGRPCLYAYYAFGCNEFLKLLSGRPERWVSRYVTLGQEIRNYELGVSKMVGIHADSIFDNILE